MSWSPMRQWVKSEVSRQNGCTAHRVETSPDHMQVQHRALSAQRCLSLVEDRHPASISLISTPLILSPILGSKHRLMEEMPLLHVLDILLPILAIVSFSMVATMEQSATMTAGSSIRGKELGMSHPFMGYHLYLSPLVLYTQLPTLDRNCSFMVALMARKTSLPLCGAIRHIGSGRMPSFTIWNYLHVLGMPRFVVVPIFLSMEDMNLPMVTWIPLCWSMGKVARGSDLRPNASMLCHHPSWVLRLHLLHH